MINFISVSMNRYRASIEKRKEAEATAKEMIETLEKINAIDNKANGIDKKEVVVQDTNPDNVDEGSAQVEAEPNLDQEETNETNFVEEEVDCHSFTTNPFETQPQTPNSLR